MLSKCLRVSLYVFEVAGTLPYRDLVISNHYPAANVILGIDIIPPSSSHSQAAGGVQLRDQASLE